MVSIERGSKRATAPTGFCANTSQILFQPAVLNIRSREPKFTMTGCLIAFVMLVATVQCHMHGKEHFLTDALLREVVDRMGRDMADSYLDVSDSGYLGGRRIKDLGVDDDGYPIELEGLAPPSLRDREFLQHSSLWGSQFIAGGSGEGSQRLKPDGSILSQPQMKTDPTLPAYCNPPNPCPVGYSAEDGCLEDFENTAAFSRKYQAAQECMCDTEHMFHCPINDYDATDLEDSIMNELVVPDHHKNLVAKKFHSKKSSNPFLQGDKLPVAAKKGLKLVAD